LANVKYVLSNNENALSGFHLERVYSEEINIYENLTWKPRAYMCYRFEVMERDSILDRLRSLDWGSDVVFFDEEPAEKLDAKEFPAENCIGFEETQNNYLRLNVDTESEGYLVLTDNYYPGWKARVNGESKKIYRANYTMRAVSIGPGNNTVEFFFRPSAFQAGVVLSFCSFGIVILCMFFKIKGHRRNRSLDFEETKKT
jgi:hypothetical protein